MGYSMNPGCVYDEEGVNYDDISYGDEPCDMWDMYGSDDDDDC